MVKALLNVVKEQTGQDLAEYCLLVAFLALLAGGIMLRVSGGMQNLWTTANSSLASSSTASTGAATASAPAQ